MFRSRRGHVLILTAVVLTAAVVGSSLVTARVDARIEEREADMLRLQALTLARGALDAGVTGVRQVETPAGTAVVRVRRGATTRIEVDLEGAQAVVSSPPYTERYSPAED